MTRSSPPRRASSRRRWTRRCGSLPRARSIAAARSAPARSPRSCAGTSVAVAKADTMARVTDTAATRRTDRAVRRHQLRAVISASVGTTIEWYDFFLYGVAAAAVFPQKFFPGSEPFVATLLSFTTFFVGFVARPVGAAIFGHFGDKVGRKKLLVFTMIVMGASTMAVGLTPSYEVIGVWGAVFLTLGRILQGLAIGGQWSGSVLIVSELNGSKPRRVTTS